MSRAATVIEDLLKFGLTQEQICDKVEIDRAHLSRIKNRKVSPRERLISQLEKLRGDQLRQISSTIQVLHCCVAGRRPVDDRVKQEAAAAVYAALRRIVEVQVPDVRTFALAVDLPDGIDGITVRLGQDPGIPLIALRAGLNPEQETRVLLHELKEFEQALRRAAIKGRSLSLPKLFKPSTER